MPKALVVMTIFEINVYLGIIFLILFVIFEINVYHTASQTGLTQFTALEWVGAALFASACASLIPVLQLQIIFAAAVMIATVWYLYANERCNH